MNDQAYLRRWLSGFLPVMAATSPREWLRVSCGCTLGLLLSMLVCTQLFPERELIHLFGPVAATSVLLFAVPSGVLAQPWSVFMSYVASTVLAVALGQYLGHSLAVASLAVGLSVLCMSLLRCLHPPAGAVALSLQLGGAAIYQQGFGVITPMMTAVGGLLVCALIYNNLTGVRYPKPARGVDLHDTCDPLPERRIGISDNDLEHALEEFGEFVDLTREDLAKLIRSTERHALKRSMGELLVEQVMSRDLRCVSLKTRRQQALAMLRRHRVRSLPVLDDERRLVGIVSLVDLISRPRGRSLRTFFGLGRAVLVEQLMSSPVRCIDSRAHVVELIPLLSSHGLHCVPVLSAGELVGIITQTDLIAALQHNLLERFA